MRIPLTLSTLPEVLVCYFATLLIVTALFFGVWRRLIGFEWVKVPIRGWVRQRVPTKRFYPTTITILLGATSGTVIAAIQWSWIVVVMGSILGAVAGGILGWVKFSIQVRSKRNA